MTFYNFTVELTNAYGSYVLQFGHKYKISVSTGSGHGVCGTSYVGILEGVFTANRRKMLRIIDPEDDVFKTCIFIDDIDYVKEIED